MVWYVALIAILNLGLGYALAMYVGASRPQMAATTGHSFDDSEYTDISNDEYAQI
ncbi:MAG TPA: hypothetical protein VHE81_05080 [Lacipirellulaceae bacterium]|nr:hypothetical protein [Lacipirellulaceae bacterium]